MDDKTADNKINIVKSQINQIDNQIYNRKSELKSLIDIHDKYISVYKDISKCISLIRSSIKGNNIDKMLDAMEINNNKHLNKITDEIEENKVMLKNEIKHLNQKKDEIEEQKRKDHENEK